MADSAFTVFTLGDTSTFRTMLEGVALVFQDPFFSSNSFMGLGVGVFFGALILLSIMVYQAAFSKKMDISTLILPLFAYILLTGPKVDLKVVDVYNVDNPQIVSNIPIGLAMPLTVASGAAYVVSREFDKAYSTPNSPRLLTDGFVSPLKTLYALRYVSVADSSPYLASMVTDTYKACIANDSSFDPQEYLNSPDSFVYFTNFLREKSVGIVGMNELDGYKNYSCSQMGDKITKAFNAYVQGDSSDPQIKSTFAQAVSLAMQGMDKSGSPVKFRSSEDIAKNFAQITDSSAARGQQFVLNTLLNQTLGSASNCASKETLDQVKADREKGMYSSAATSQCASWIMANEQQAEDNAAAATGMVKVLQDGQNVLIIIAILFFPMIVILIMYMGKNAAKPVASYLMYLASVYLWLPMATCINFYIYVKLGSTIRAFSQTGTDDLSSVLLTTDYGQFYEAISNALSLANGLLATLPVFCMMFFSGMTMGAMAIMNRWNAGGGKNYDVSQNTPTFQAPTAIVSSKSMAASNGVQQMHYQSGGAAFDGSVTKSYAASQAKISSLQTTKAQIKSQMQSVNDSIDHAEAKSLAGSSTLKNTFDHSGKTTVTVQDGMSYLISKETGDVLAIKISSGDAGEKGDISTDQQKFDSGHWVRLRAGVHIGDVQGGLVSPIDQQQSTTTIPTDGSTPIAPISLNQISSGQQNQQPKDSGTSAASLFKKLKSLSLLDISVGSQDNSSRINTEGDQHRSTPKSESGSIEYAPIARANQTINRDLKGETTSNILSGHAENDSQNVVFSQTTSDGQTTSNIESLKMQRKELQAKLDSIERSIQQEVSTAFTTTLDMGDVFARISRMPEISNSLEALAVKAQEEQGLAWQEAVTQAKAMIKSAGFLPQEAESRAVENFLAAMTLGGEFGADAWFAMTGIRINIPNPSEFDDKNIDWDNFISKDHDRQMAFVKSRNLDGMDIPDISAMQFSQPTNGQLMHGHLRVMGSQQERYMAMTYNALLDAGLSASAARIMIAQIGRESSFLEKNLFGSHKDKLKDFYNSGLISWNQGRKIALDTIMQKAGMLESGKIGGFTTYRKSQESLNIQAQFMVNELKSNNKGWSSAYKILESEKASQADKHRAIGDDYIVWAASAKYGSISTSGWKNLDDYQNAFDKVLEKQEKFANAPKQQLQTSSASTGLRPVNGELIAHYANDVDKGTILGVVGNSGSNPLAEKEMGVHLDIRYDGKLKGQRISNEHLARIGVGKVGKPLNRNDWKITSDVGLRDVKNASSNHMGTDFLILKGTKLVNNSDVAISNIETYYQKPKGDKHGGGYVTRITYADGVAIQLLHQDQQMKSLVAKKANGAPVIKNVNRATPDLIPSSIKNAESFSNQGLAAEYAAKGKQDIEKFKEGVAEEFGVSVTKDKDGTPRIVPRDDSKLRELNNKTKTTYGELGDALLGAWRLKQHPDTDAERLAKQNLTNNVNETELASRDHEMAAIDRAGNSSKSLQEDEYRKIISDLKDRSENGGMDFSQLKNIKDQELRDEVRKEQIKKFSELEQDAKSMIESGINSQQKNIDDKLAKLKQSSPELYAKYSAEIEQYRSAAFSAGKETINDLNSEESRRKSWDSGMMNLVNIATNAIDQ